MPGPALVLLAAGLGSRFGGPKQLAPIGPQGDALIDYTARDALAAGFERLVLVVRSEIGDAVADHVEGRWPAGVRPEYVFQDRDPVAVEAVRSGRAKPLGTAHAVLVAGVEAGLDGPFGVANADDIYGRGALGVLAAHLNGDGGHALVAYHLAHTLLGDRPVNRALCRVTPEGTLAGVVEGEVRQDGAKMTWAPLGAHPSEAVEVTGDELVSVNLWGFTPAMLPVLAAAFEEFTAGDAITRGEEIFLPTVVGERVADGSVEVAVLATEERCLGITHPDDVPLLQATLGGPAW